METLAEHRQRTALLEHARAQRRADGPAKADILGTPIEIADGRGDLRYSSTYHVSPGVYGWGWGGGWSATTVSYAEIFATQPWIAAAVMRMLTWAVRVPLKVYRRTGDDSRERVHPGEHPLADAIAHPWDRAGQAQLIQALLGPTLVHGNGLVEIDQGRSGAIRFAPADWRLVTPIIPFEYRIAGWQIGEPMGTGERTIPVDQALHVCWWSPLGPLGISPLQQLGTTLSVEDSAQQWARSSFRNSARPPSAITVDETYLSLNKDIRDPFFEQARQDISALYAGPENAGRPALLPPGFDWKPIGHTAVEAELIDQRRVNREEIAAVYQIPPPMLGILERATYSNIETQREMSYTDALGPPLVLIEQAINSQLVHSLLRDDDIYVEFDFGQVLRGDRLKEIQSFREGIQTGVYTPNEARRALNLPASSEPGADELWMPKNNLAPLSAEQPEPSPAPFPPPPMPPPTPQE